MLNISKAKTGLDLRYHPANSLPGTFLELKNCHLTRGGEIEKRKAFVAEFDAAGTVGLASLSGRLYAFGSDPRPAGLDDQLGYIQLQSQSASPLEEVLSATRFSGKDYIVARFQDGSVRHFYGDASVDWWDTENGFPIETLQGAADHIARMIDGEADYRAVADGNVIDIFAGIDATVESRVLNATGDAAATHAIITPFQADTPEARAQGALRPASSIGEQLDSLTVDGINVIGVPVPALPSVADTAQAIADEVNRYSPFEAHVDSGYVILTAPANTGAALNGADVQAYGTMGISDLTQFAGGSDAASGAQKHIRVTLTCTYEPDATYQVVLNAQDYSKDASARNNASYVRAFGNKVFAVFDEYLAFSALADGTFWDPLAPTVDQDGAQINPIGAGHLRLTDYASEARSLTAIAPYATSLAGFGEKSIALINVDPDPNLTGVSEIIENSGTRFPNSVRSLGARDILFVSDDGVRSLRTQVDHDAPLLDDIGAQIDDAVTDAIRDIGAKRHRAVWNVRDADARSWIIFGSQAFCLSVFPSSGIVAWSRYDLPGEVSEAVYHGDTVWMRIGDQIYAYGGQLGTEYDATEAEVISYFEDDGDPDTTSSVSKLTAVLRGAWDVEILLDPLDLSIAHRIGQVDDAAGTAGRISFNASAPSYAVKATSKGDGPAVISTLRVS